MSRLSPRTLSRAALMIALTTVATLVIRIPNPATQGYINLGDSLIFTFALLFGGRAAGLAGGLGAALADGLSGYMIWAPWTLIIKGTEGFLAGTLAAKAKVAPRKWMRRTVETLALIVAGLWMTAGYYLAGGLLFGWMAALTETPGNLIQAGVGALAAFPLSALLRRTLQRGHYGIDAS